MRTVRIKRLIKKLPTNQEAEFIKEYDAVAIYPLVIIDDYFREYTYYEMNVNVYDTDNETVSVDFILNDFEYIKWVTKLDPRLIYECKVEQFMGESFEAKKVSVLIPSSKLK